MHVLMISVTEASVVDRSGVFACSVDMHAKRDTGPGCIYGLAPGTILRLMSS
jgi:hypothetical protein